jgi:hypothetical protein
MPMPQRNGGGNPIHNQGQGQGHPHAIIGNNSFNHNSGLGIWANGSNSMMMSSPPSGTTNNNVGLDMNGFNTFYPDHMMGR